MPTGAIRVSGSPMSTATTNIPQLSCGAQSTRHDDGGALRARDFALAQTIFAPRAGTPTATPETLGASSARCWGSTDRAMPTGAPCRRPDADFLGGRGAAITDAVRTTYRLVDLGRRLAGQEPMRRRSGANSIFRSGGPGFSVYAPGGAGGICRSKMPLRAGPGLR